MAYTKQTWKNLPDESTPISAERLNHLETQYEESVSYTNSELSQIPPTPIIKGSLSPAKREVARNYWPNPWMKPSDNWANVRLNLLHRPLARSDSFDLSASVTPSWNNGYVDLSFPSGLSTISSFLRTKEGSGVLNWSEGQVYTARVRVKNVGSTSIPVCVGFVIGKTGEVSSAATVGPVVVVSPGEEVDLFSAPSTVLSNWEDIRPTIRTVSAAQPIPSGSVLRVYDGFTVEQGDSVPTILHGNMDPADFPDVTLRWLGRENDSPTGLSRKFVSGFPLPIYPLQVVHDEVGGVDTARLAPNPRNASAGNLRAAYNFRETPERPLLEASGTWRAKVIPPSGSTVTPRQRAISAGDPLRYTNGSASQPASEVLFHSWGTGSSNPALSSTWQVYLNGPERNEAWSKPVRFTEVGLYEGFYRGDHIAPGYKPPVFGDREAVVRWLGEPHNSHSVAEVYDSLPSSGASVGDAYQVDGYIFQLDQDHIWRIVGPQPEASPVTATPVEMSQSLLLDSGVPRSSFSAAPCEIAFDDSTHADWRAGSTGRAVRLGSQVFLSGQLVRVAGNTPDSSAVANVGYVFPPFTPNLHQSGGFGKSGFKAAGYNSAGALVDVTVEISQAGWISIIPSAPVRRVFLSGISYYAEDVPFVPILEMDEFRGTYFKRWMDENGMVEGRHYTTFHRRGADPRVASLAIHGGLGEPGSTVAAIEYAKLARSSLYYLNMRAGSLYPKLHMNSNGFDDPRAVRLVKEAQRTLSFHGAVDFPEYPGLTTFIGGSDIELRMAIIDKLSSNGFPCVDAATFISSLGGSAATNICNLGKNGGVQLELSTQLRLAMHGITSGGFTRDASVVRSQACYDYVGLIDEATQPFLT